jgi:hypothetical protein
VRTCHQVRNRARCRVVSRDSSRVTGMTPGAFAARYAG